MTWRADGFIYAHPESGKPTRAGGYVHPRGLGYFRHDAGQWTVVHLNTGLTVCYLVDVPAHLAREIASELLECGDWDWNSIKGWENLAPDLQENVADVAAHHGARISFGNNIRGADARIRAVNAARAN